MDTSADATISDALRNLFPRPHTATHQSIVVNADAATTFATILVADLRRSWTVRILTSARALPDRILRRLRRLPPPPKPETPSVAGLIEAGYWVVLAEQPDRELALGLAMWDREIEAHGLTRERFDCAGGGAVRVGWSFVVEPLGGDRSRCRLSTETRTEPVDRAARRRFRRYWRVISPFAGLTRRLVLKAIAREAEAHAHPRGSVVTT
jgi:hypothetical protein